jgi:hypothetical protein
VAVLLDLIGVEGHMILNLSLHGWVTQPTVGANDRVWKSCW